MVCRLIQRDGNDALPLMGFPLKTITSVQLLEKLSTKKVWQLLQKILLVIHKIIKFILKF